ncbi:MAG: hypothetical protein E3J90_06310 [Promethearchaeota archaeon]|nr:MAG: hypothetical protein E3J90_06310 [Candidatus Lokiarchaeota archaeon]
MTTSTTLTSRIFKPLLLKGLPPKNSKNAPTTNPNKPIREPKAIKNSKPAITSEKYDPTSISNQNCNVFLFDRSINQTYLKGKMHLSIEKKFVLYRTIKEIKEEK